MLNFMFESDKQVWLSPNNEQHVTRTTGSQHACGVKEEHTINIYLPLVHIFWFFCQERLYNNVQSYVYQVTYFTQLYEI